LAYNEELVIRIRPLLSGQKKVVEKKMFSGIAFMVNGKMCLTVGRDRIMCRIDPERQEEVVEKDGCSAMKMRGKDLRGWVTVQEDVLLTKRELEFWVNLALDFNKKAKPSRKK